MEKAYKIALAQPEKLAHKNCAKTLKIVQNLAKMTKIAQKKVKNLL